MGAGQVAAPKTARLVETAAPLQALANLQQQQQLLLLAGPHCLIAGLWAISLGRLTEYDTPQEHSKLQQPIKIRVACPSDTSAGMATDPKVLNVSMP